MIIKKFQGKTEAEAVDTAKKELGNNVVVMNVRNVKKKGVFSFLSAQTVEVTVALEDENERYGNGSIRKEERTNLQSAAKPAPAAKKLDILVDDKAANDPALSHQQKNQKQVNHQQNQMLNSQNNKMMNIQQNHLMPDQVVTANVALEEKLDSLHSLLEQQLQKPEEEKEDPEEKEGHNEMYVFMRLLYNTMIDNEVNEKYANQIIDELEKNNKPNMPFDYALSNIYQKMILKFGKPAVIQPAENGTKVVFFIGPTGVGKTTTIAKIASRFSVEERKKVALLTADTYRIAAAEQLRTYANILEVPFRVIYTKEEIEQAMTDFKDYDFVLVDTAGHSHQNETQRENMNNFIHSVDGLVEKEVFLVLSATTKYRDLVSIADTYSEMTEYKLIFTKLDETTTLGNLLNLKLYTGASLSYMTCGQNVPDDIEEFNPQKTVKQLLGGRK